MVKRKDETASTRTFLHFYFVCHQSARKKNCGMRFFPSSQHSAWMIVSQARTNIINFMFDRLRLHISIHPRRLVAGNNVMWMERAHENHASQVSMACVTPIVVVRRQLCATMPRIYHQPESLGELYSTSLWFFLCVHFEFSANASNECVCESALGAKDQVVTVCDDDSGSFVICVRCFVASGSKTKKNMRRHRRWESPTIFDDWHKIAKRTAIRYEYAL